MEKAASRAQSALISLARLPTTGPWPTQSPFLFCAYHNDTYPHSAKDTLGPEKHHQIGRHMGSDFSGKDGFSYYHGSDVPGFPRHPHTGMTTLTVTEQGLLDHADSLGSCGRYGNGDAQWMTAGAGIQHSEMMPLINRDAENPGELFQLWLNMPSADKETKASYSMLWSESIPTYEHTNEQGAQTRARVIAGAVEDKVGLPAGPGSYAARPESNVRVLVISVDAGGSWTLPTVEENIKINRSLFVFMAPEQGFSVNGRPISNLCVLELRAHRKTTLSNASDEVVKLLLLEGTPIDEDVAWRGPFVAGSQQKLAEKVAQYHRTQFGGWPWSSNAPTFGRERGRFIKHPDGTVEEPK